MARALDFALLPEKEFPIPLLADAQSAGVQLETNSRLWAHLRIPRERDTKISPMRHGAALLGAVSLTHENDRDSKNISAAHAYGLFHNLAYRD
jgi:hypothetical protein